MNYRKFYEDNGIDYDAFLQRMMGKESLLEKYIQMFMSDPTYDELSHAMDLEDFEQVGFKAHTLKGVALNLQLEQLATFCMDIVTSVRNQNTQDLEMQFKRVKAEYTHIMEGLSY